MSDSVTSVMNCIREVFAGKGQIPPPLEPQTAIDESLGLRSLDIAELVIRLDGEFGWEPLAQGLDLRSVSIERLARIYENRPPAAS